ncbi:restriction endonuclease subunit S [Pilosibacter sp. HC1M1C21]|uniref:restriction endonuclease subunit S n=1 Tax=Pilosibacter sp. HC1M1C21 TaxID=3378803 RepID=UPI00385C751D
MMNYIALKDVCTINMGQSPESSSYNEIGDGIPFFQGNADFGERYPITRVWCNKPTKVAKAEDILISVRAPIGAMNYAKEKCCIGRGVAALTPNEEKVSSEFIFWLLKGKNNELNQKGTGSTFKAIGRKVLEEIQVPEINLELQRKYASNLERIYSIIQDRQRQLEQLDKLVRARFVEMFGDENNSKNWNVVNVEDVADVQVGVVIKPSQYYTDESEGVRAFRSLNIGAGFIKDIDWVYFTKEGHLKNSKSTLKENDLLIVRSGAPGTACVVTEEYAGCNAVDIIIAHPDCEKVNPYYLCTFTNMPHGKKQIDEGIGGAAQQHFNVGKYNKLQLMLPPKTLQDEFGDFINQVDKSKLQYHPHTHTCQPNTS